MVEDVFVDVEVLVAEETTETVVEEDVIEDRVEAEEELDLPELAELFSSLEEPLPAPAELSEPITPDDAPAELPELLPPKDAPAELPELFSGLDVSPLEEFTDSNNEIGRSFTPSEFPDPLSCAI